MWRACDVTWRARDVTWRDSSCRDKFSSLNEITRCFWLILIMNLLFLQYGHNLMEPMHTCTLSFLLNAILSIFSKKNTGIFAFKFQYFVYKEFSLFEFLMCDLHTEDIVFLSLYQILVLFIWAFLIRKIINFIYFSITSILN